MVNDELVTTIQRALGSLRSHPGQPLPLHEPCFEGKEWDYVKDCLDTKWVSSVGQYVDSFEEKLAAFTGAHHVVACVNGTAALQVCLQLSGVQAGDEVLLPALTFAATANAAVYLGARPHFVDVEADSFGVCPDKLAAYLDAATVCRQGVCYSATSGAPIRALVVVHVFGHPARLAELQSLCAAHHLTLVEDACESLGSFYQGQHTGRVGRLAALSFNGNKIMTTGGGGAILSDEQDLAVAAKQLTTTGKQAHPWEYIHHQVAYNFRLPNLNAALGCAQLEQLPSMLRRKRVLARRYEQVFQEVPGVRFLTEPSYACSNYWLNALILADASRGLRDAILAANHREQIFTRPLWRPLHLLPHFASCPRMNLATTEDLYERVINLPSSASLVRDDEPQA